MPDQAEIIPDPTPMDVESPPTTQNTVTRHKFTFPPWPTIPEGVTIMTFKNFKQRGIQIAPGPDDEEIDTLGIVTVAVKTRHSSDVCKTNTKRKKRLEEDAKKAAAGIKKDLWEQWEDKESTRMTSAHAHITIIEKIQQAAADFRNGRPWPKTVDSQHNPERIWQQFLNFCGLGDNAPQPKKKLHIKAFKADGDDDGDDDFSDDDNGELTDANVRDRKILSFVDNPETTIKIFMSSYSRHKGLIWAEDNLKAIPRLMGFWIDFLIRNKVLPSSERNAKLKRAKEITTLALKEYHLTAKISKTIPDDFSAGCNECWGTKADVYRTLTLDLPPPAPVAPAEDLDVTMTSGHIAELTDLETSAANVTIATEAGTTTEIPNVSGWDANIDTNTTSGWPKPVEGGPATADISDTGTGWGSVDTSDTGAGWGSVWSNTVQPGEEPTTDEFVWSSSKPISLLPLLGPTALPLTHVPGIVESSMRRVKSINLPPQTVATAPVSEGPDAEAVELELEKQFARVVLSPWLNWDGGEVPAFSKPRILESSVGDVVDPLSPSPAPVQGNSAGTTAKKPHDPSTDDITVLLRLSTAEDLSEGVGLAGTWVQLARVPKVERGDGEPPAKKKKKSKSKSSALKKGGYWYVDDLTVTVPSFWAVVGGASGGAGAGEEVAQ